MRVLVLNFGSSSLKADVIDTRTGAHAASHQVERMSDPAAALADALPTLLADGPVQAVGHRVVHGGEAFSAPTLVDDAVETTIEAITPLAPLHNPANLAGLRAARAALPDIPHVAVFDTAFHATLPRRARTYALPVELAQKHGLRRYGFHGTSHAWVAQTAADALGEDLRDLRVITCHIGNGASVCAVEGGRSVETSMGMTPLEGLVMGTRSGDVDPGVLVELMRREGLDAEGLDKLLNRLSGLAGLSGVGNDLRDIEERAADGDERCQLAIHVMTHRLRKYVGAYAAVMGGVDLIVFTAGIGEHSALVRHRVASRLEFLGARLDEAANRDAKVSIEAPVSLISAPHSRVRIAVVATDEARAIAVQTQGVLQASAPPSTMQIPIAVSARHVHLTEEAVEHLFGKGHTLTPLRPLSQPGQFACEETLTLLGPKRSIERVRVLGPARSAIQVEISRSDEFHLGLDAPVRASGDVAYSPGITLVGREGRSLAIDEGVICAWRHIHMTPDDAERFGVKDRDVVKVALDTDGRDLVFGDVLVRVKDSYALEMHIDTDEANAAELRTGDAGALVDIGVTGHLSR